jgi:hypothetical protein
MDLARSLGIGLSSRGVCCACLTFPAFELESGDEQRVMRHVRQIAPTLWNEGLDATVRSALERAVARNVAGAADALADLKTRGCRSEIFLGVIRHLTDELEKDMRRAARAWLN